MSPCVECGEPASAVTVAGKCLGCCAVAIAAWREHRRLHPPKPKAKKKGQRA